MQEYSHAVLLSVSSLITLLATLLAMLVSVYDVLVSVLIVLCCLTSTDATCNLLGSRGWGVPMNSLSLHSDL